MSEFKFACPVCGQHITCDSAQSGTSLDCPTCFQKLIVPNAPAGESSKFILAATQAPGKRPVTAAPDVSATPPQRPRGLPFLWAGLALVLLVGAGVALVGSGWLKPRPASLPPTRTNDLQQPAPEPVAPDPRWRLDLAEASLATNTASGRILGREFQLQRATIQEGTFALRQGPTWPPDVGVTILLPKRPAEHYAGKRIFIPPNYTGKAPRVVLRIKDDQQREVTTSFSGGYALRLEFGQPAEGRLPGRIYLCVPDPAKSVVVGSFSAEIRLPNRP